MASLSRPSTALRRVAALVFAACAAGTSVADPELEACADAASLEQALVQLNELRRATGAPCSAAAPDARALHWESRLASSAWAQASDLARRDRLSHVDAQQRGLGARLHSVGYAAREAGENLAAGQDQFDQTLAAWLASPSHCANLMASGFSDVGLACVQRRGTRYERFWVAHLGAPARR